MPTTLESSRTVYGPPCIVADSFAAHYIGDGIQEWRRWDGVDDTTIKMGVIAPTAAATATMDVGGAATAGDYDLYYRYIRTDGVPGNLSPILTKTATANQEFNWAGVADHASAWDKQLWRTIANESGTVYLVDTLTNGTTTYVDQKSDATLQAGTAMPILNPDLSANANRFGVPPIKFCAAWHLDRMWFTGDVVYNEGSCEVTNGSPTVQGRGTAWTTEMGTERFRFYKEGEDEEYTISSVNEGTQAITLTGNYNGTTDLFGQFAIREEKPEKDLVYYSYVLEPESVPADSSVALPADGDDITGLIPLRQYMFVTKNRFIYRLDPAAMQGRATPITRPSISVVYAAGRGCVNHRCWVRVEDICYILDDRGVYAFDGSGVQDVSEGIRDYWRGAINFRAKKWFHASHDPASGRIRFHVAIGDSYLPTHSLIYDYRRNRWEGEEKYPWMLGANCLGHLYPGQLTTMFGGEFGKHYLFEGTLDGTTQRTIRIAATAATQFSITGDASYMPSNPVGSVVSIVSGKGKGQRPRRIVAMSSGKLTVKDLFYPVPDTTSVFQIGGVDWLVKTPRFRFPPSKERTERMTAITADPTDAEATLDVRQYFDRELLPMNYTVDNVDNEGITISRNSPDAVVNLQRARTQGAETWEWSGYSQPTRQDSHLGYRRSQQRMIAIELRGVQGVDPIGIHSLEVVGAG